MNANGFSADSELVGHIGRAPRLAAIERGSQRTDKQRWEASPNRGGSKGSSFFVAS